MIITCRTHPIYICWPNYILVGSELYICSFRHVWLYEPAGLTFLTEYKKSREKILRKSWKRCQVFRSRFCNCCPCDIIPIFTSFFFNFQRIFWNSFLILSSKELKVRAWYWSLLFLHSNRCQIAYLIRKFEPVFYF